MTVLLDLAQARAARAKRPTHEEAYAAALRRQRAERARCAELSDVAAQAARLGVDFDLASAIAEGVSADDARRVIIDALVARVLPPPSPGAGSTACAPFR